MKDNEDELHQSILDFENAYRTIPEQISCSRLSVTKRDLSTVIQPRAWVSDSPISAFMNLVNQGNIIALDKAFITLFRSAVLQKAIGTYADFLRHFFGRSSEPVLRRLMACQAVLIPLFISDFQGKNGNHWGLVVLHKTSASLRIYDSMHFSFLFKDVTSHLVRLANSICNRYEIPTDNWPMEWKQSRELFSTQQRNGDDCGVFTTLNAFYVSCGIHRPRVVPGQYVSRIYRPQLALCILENTNSVLL